jgi:hypothetical protein
MCIKVLESRRIPGVGPFAIHLDWIAVQLIDRFKNGDRNVVLLVCLRRLGWEF